MKAKFADPGRYRQNLLLKMGVKERVELHSETEIGDLIVQGNAVWTCERSQSTLGDAKYLVEAIFTFDDGSAGCFSIIRNEDQSLPASHILALDFSRHGRSMDIRLVGFVSHAAHSGIEGPFDVVELYETEKGLSIAGLLAEENPLVNHMVCMTEATSFHVQFLDERGSKNAVLLPLGNSGREGFNRFMKAENRAYVAGVMRGYEHATPPTLTLPHHLRTLEVRH